MKMIESVTYMMVPFCFDTEISLDNNAPILVDTEVWKPAKMKVEKGILYPHIQHFLQASVQYEEGKSAPLQPHDYRVFSLNREVNFSIAALYHHPMGIRVNGETIKFRLMNKDNSLNSTTLVICPNARVGVIMVAFSLEKESLTVDHLIDFNYFLHKTDQQAVPCYLSLKFELEAALQQGTAASDPYFERKLASYQRQSQELSRFSQDPGIQKSPKSTLADWKFTRLLDYFFSTIFVPTHRMNPLRTHPFNFYQLRQEEVYPEMMNDFLLLSKCQNHSYQTLDSDHSIVQQTFDNIYAGSCVEGGALLVVSPDEPSDFFQNFSSATLPHRYMWLYLMVVMQRTTLLHMIDLLTNVEDYSSPNKNNSLSRMRHFMQMLAEVKVNTYFTDVSDFTHHNLFYRNCCRNLGIDSHYQEIDSKMLSLTNHLNQLSSLRKEKISLIFTVFIGCLTIASASNDGMDLFTKLTGNSSAVLLDRIFGCSILFIMVLLIVVIYSLMKRSIR